jgi:citronellol/citronellal dehydrogenase
MCTIGMAAEFKGRGIWVNSLWPRTAIATAAIEMLMGEAGMRGSRKPSIMSDAAYAVFTHAGELTGQLLIDEDFLRTTGKRDFEDYAVVPGGELYPDFFIEA